MKKTIPVLILLSGFLIQPALSQNDSANISYAITDTQNVNIKLFESDDLFEIALRFDISYYKRKKPDTAYMDAILTYYLGDKDSVNKNIKLKARGEIRRTQICDFPPLYLNFSMKDSVAGEFIGINKLKLVPYCKLGYEDYILREYLIYKLYNVLTDNSLKVRLLRINFINTARESKPIRQYGFAIEPVKLFLKRTHTYELKSMNLTQRNIKPEMMDRFAIFNYMIGNTDWSVPSLHNALILSQPFSERNDLAMIVPFDFDYSGLVNTDYAVPFESLPIKTVRDRLYLAVCRSEDSFKNALKEFSGKKEEFYRVINDFPYLKPKSKKDMINYLDGFFDEFDKRNAIVLALSQDCRWFEEQSNLKVRE
jgi:hypothetical protein